MAHITTVNNSNDSWDNTSAGLIAVGVFEDKSFTPMAEAINELSNGSLSEGIDLGDVKGKTGESHYFYVSGKRILLLGLGKKDKFGSDAVRLVAGKVSRAAISKKIDSVAMECFCENCEYCQSCGEGL
ncbi:MAG: hypothetical protein HN654_07745, partial [Candidatus Marinimicrobia bacterium]|nr:hypothetical protein [Candidatus Neomarinimicrobiota bacterium]